MIVRPSVLGPLLWKCMHFFAWNGGQHPPDPDAMEVFLTAMAVIFPCCLCRDSCGTFVDATAKHDGDAFHRTWELHQLVNKKLNVTNQDEDVVRRRLEATTSWPSAEEYGNMLALMALGFEVDAKRTADAAAAFFAAAQTLAQGCPSPAVAEKARSLGSALPKPVTSESLLKWLSPENLAQLRLACKW